MSRYEEKTVVNGALRQIGVSFMAIIGTQKQRHAVFQCECGRRLVSPVFRVKSGHSLSCGCKRAGKPSPKASKHGHTETRFGKTTTSRTYRIWNSMRSRCEYPSHTNYRFYGGRGITVCERWKSFEMFLADVGKIAEGMSLDRIDSNGNYEPSNVRVIPIKLQARNKRSNRFFEIDGKTQTLIEWVNEIGVVSYSTAHARLRQGWSIVSALTIPKRSKKQ